MSGRGCTITVQVIGGCFSSSSSSFYDSNPSSERTEDLSLPVALHSPLLVLKEQLQSLTGIPIADQVLILCDLSDIERNSDRLLQGLDDYTLRECSITAGSFLTLHALGLSAEAKQKLTKKVKNAGVDTEKATLAGTIHSLDTPITAAQANHSYNGVIFDVESTGPYEVDILSISIAGMLNRVRVFARNCGWEEDKPSVRQSPHWWAHRDSLSTVGWELVADVTCRPSWDKPIEIPFSTPVKLEPHRRRALYCHSGLPDDLGIQYQSYHVGDIVASDEHITLHPGLGHTGSEPFDEVRGWYRSYRGLAGRLTYAVRWKGWTPMTHSIFPKALKKTGIVKLSDFLNMAQAVFTMLLCEKCDQPFEVVYRGDSGEIAVIRNRCLKGRLSSLPLFVIYNIMEFMHHDWFANIIEPVVPLGRNDTGTPSFSPSTGRPGVNDYASNLVGSIGQQSASSLIMRVLNESGTGFLSAFAGYGNNDDDDEEDGDEDYEEEDMEEEDEEDDNDDGDDLVEYIHYPRSKKKTDCPVMNVSTMMRNGTVIDYSSANALVVEDEEEEEEEEEEDDDNEDDDGEEELSETGDLD
eukprot:gene25838-33757_t